MKQARPPRRGGVYCVRPRRRPARWALYAAAVSMALKRPAAMLTSSVKPTTKNVPATTS